MAELHKDEISLNSLTDCYFEIPSVENMFWAGSGVPNAVDHYDTEGNPVYVLTKPNSVNSATNFDYSWQTPTVTFAITDSALDPVYYEDTESGCGYASSSNLYSFIHKSPKYSSAKDTSRYLWVKVAQKKTIRVDPSSIDSQALFTITYPAICLGSIADIRASTGWTKVCTSISTDSSTGLTTTTTTDLSTGVTTNITLDPSTGETKTTTKNISLDSYVIPSNATVTDTFPQLTTRYFLTTTSDELTVSTHWDETSANKYLYRRNFSASAASNVSQPPSKAFPYLMIRVGKGTAGPFITHTILAPKDTYGEGEDDTVPVNVPVWYTTSYASSRTFTGSSTGESTEDTVDEKTGNVVPAESTESKVLGTKVVRDNIKLIRFKVSDFRLMDNTSNSNPIWDKPSADYGLSIPVTINPRRFWSWVRTTNRHSQLSWRLPSLMSWQQVKDEGRLILGKYDSGSLSYATRILIEPYDESSTTIDELSYLLGARQLVDSWVDDTLPLVNNNGVYQLDTNWKYKVKYKTEEVFPTWISVKAYTKTRTETNSDGTSVSSLVVPSFNLQVETCAKGTGTGSTEIAAQFYALSNAVWSRRTTEGGIDIDGSPTYGNFNLGIVGDPRIPNYDAVDGDKYYSVTFDTTTNLYTVSLVIAKYIVTFNAESRNAAQQIIDDNYNQENWAGRANKLRKYAVMDGEVDKKWLGIDTIYYQVSGSSITGYTGTIEAYSLAQALPDPYHTAKSMDEWPVAIEYTTEDRLTSIGSKDNPNSYNLINLGTSSVVVDSECNYYAFVPTVIGRYRFSADSDNAFIGYATTQIDNGTGLEVFGEATWADDGISFELNCVANKMVYIACSTADFSHDTYNLTIELVTD